MNKSLHKVQGTSSKYYLIGSKNCSVHVKHGRADIVNGKIIPASEHKPAIIDYSSPLEATKHIVSIIESKLGSGYLYTSPSMRPALNVFAAKKKKAEQKTQSYAHNCCSPD